MRKLIFFLTVAFCTQSAIPPREQELIPEEILQKIKTHDALCSWKGLYYDVLPQLIIDQKIRNVLEVGVALGGHAESILKNSELDTYIGIDPYEPYDPNDGFQIDVGNYSSLGMRVNFDFLYAWVKNVRLKPYGDRAKLIRKTSSEASAFFEDESLDCIFIDGDHRYDAVMRDLATWFPKLKKGRLILGDDYWMKGVSRAVDAFFRLHEREVIFFESRSGYKIWAVYK